MDGLTGPPACIQPEVRVEPASSTSSPRVLCVTASAEELNASIVARIRQAGGTLEFCPDVFRALARIGQSELAAVLVQIDWLPDSQFEFFRILRHRRRELPVFVFGDVRARLKIARAVEAGATGVLDMEELSRRLADLQPQQSPPENLPGPAVEPEAHPREDRNDGASGGFARAGNVFDIEDGGERAAPAADSGATPGPDEPEAGAKGETGLGTSQVDKTADEHAVPPTEAKPASKPAEPRPEKGRPKGRVRVPWVQYDEGPKRIPPGQGGSTPPPSEPDGSDEEEPPLLSAEEIEALLGDDSTLEDEEGGRLH